VTPRVPGLVSVIMAAYNCEAYVADAIGSVLAQRGAHFELIVIDDGSTDSTRHRIVPFLGDTRVKYHRQQNAGQTAAKNAGIRRSRGEFIAFCDADDVWLPMKLAVQIPAFANPNVGVVYSRSARMDAEGRALPVDVTDEPPRPSGRVTSELFGVNFVPFPTAVVRGACLDRCGAFDERYRMGIDWELWLRLSLEYEFRFVDQETAVYRVWPGQMSSNWRGRYDHAFRIMREFVERHPGAVAPDAERGAWAHSYTQRARMRTAISGEYRAALGDVGRALRLTPTSLPVWKTLPAVMLAAAGIRRI